jgi:dihydroorotate dehydrogenase (fumarate)
VIHKIKQAEPDLTVIGVGGIATAEDIIEFLLAGASAVQMLSTALIKGKQMYEKIIDDLQRALEKYNFESIEDVIAAPLEITTDYEWELPRLIENKCIVCMLCEKVCPYFAITFKDKITFDHDKCTSCGLCVSKCPTDAIVMDKLEG